MIVVMALDQTRDLLAVFRSTPIDAARRAVRAVDI
jgi:hypothetical protein